MVGSEGAVRLQPLQDSSFFFKCCTCAHWPSLAVSSMTQHKISRKICHATGVALLGKQMDVHQGPMLWSDG